MLPVPAAFAQQQQSISEAAAHQASFEAAWAAQSQQQQQQQQELLHQQQQQLSQQQAQLQQQMQQVQLLQQQVQQQMQQVQHQGQPPGSTTSERHVYGGFSPSEYALAAAHLGAAGGLAGLPDAGSSQSYLPQGAPARTSIGGTVRPKRRGCIC